MNPTFNNMQTNFPSYKNEFVGVIGGGSFGTAIANILAQNRKVLMYTRNDELAKALKDKQLYRGWNMSDNIHATNSLQEVAEKCFLIFPIIPSSNFRQMMRDFAPFLRPDHILIHGTKGLEVELAPGTTLENTPKLSRKQIKTMSEVIEEESVVKRIGCISGPNLSKEIQRGDPAATVIASRFDEVMREGISALKTSSFRVHKNKDLIGVELAGVLKNIMAIAAGIASGLGYGENTRAMIIARGMAEIAIFGKRLGATPKTFSGIAGIGDLVATCCSPTSRNYTVGTQLAKGENLTQILSGMSEVAEGIKTIQIAKRYADFYRMEVPITRQLHKILFEGLSVAEAMKFLMEIDFEEDIEFF